MIQGSCPLLARCTHHVAAAIQPLQGREGRWNIAPVLASPRPGEHDGAMSHALIIILSLACMLWGAAPTPATAAAPALALPGVGTLRVTQRVAATVLSMTRDGRTVRVVLPKDDGIHPESLDSTKVVGAIPGRVLILLSDHESRPNGGSHMCGAGIETMLRVIALQPVPHQVFHQLVASCWSTIEAGDTTWDDRTRELTVERTTLDQGVEDRRTRYRIKPDGTVATLGVESLP